MKPHRCARGRARRAYTLIEVLFATTAVGILASTAAPIYRDVLDTAKMAEGIAGCGTVRTALRLYAARHGGLYPMIEDAHGGELEVIGIGERDLDGKYFEPSNYRVTSDGFAYTITVEFKGQTYALDQDGNERGTFRTAP